MNDNSQAHTLRATLTKGSLYAAPRLLGTILRYVQPDGAVVSGRIVEVEAYAQGDPASHSNAGETPRNGAMFMKAGSAYVYFTYGMYHCVNVVCGPAGVGQGVLVRAVEPVEGIEQMWRNRYHEAMPNEPNTRKLINLTSGPAKLVLALGVTKLHDKVNLLDTSGDLHIVPGSKPKQITQATRIGISKAMDRPWRWYDADSQYVSKR
jgi:DNA-3-methyladenine glycosylase